MARSNTQTNTLIKWIVMAGDILIMNGILLLFVLYRPGLQTWNAIKTEALWIVCNLAMALAMLKFSTIIHLRMVSGGDILRRVFELTIVQTLIAFLVTKALIINLPVGWLLVQIGICQLVVMVVVRVLERWAIKKYRYMGGNTRMAVFVGTDPELDSLYKRLVNNPSFGYKITGYYGEENKDKKVRCLGTVDALMAAIERDEVLEKGDEVYVCLPRREGEKIRKISEYCDNHVIRFYYVPPSVEHLGMRLKRELFDDMELFTTHEVPMENPVNKMVKRMFDIVLSVIVLTICLPLLPIVALIIRIQSPGPIFFKQKRTGVSGNDFICYKFRSMHVNKDADTAQATEYDPRKFPFGDKMRKYNIDELPQFWNVLKGDMSVVGPRPHMLYHTGLYRQQIGKYMVRHFVKPGITGWAQVTGFRGETKELWQMEERIKRDIWYIEQWSIWLDMRIVWMTVKSMFVHDENAY